MPHQDILRDTPRAAPCARPRRIVEVLLIVLVFLVVGGERPPHENESHYLCRLKHYWNPAWCAGDLFLESADAQLALIWSLGWLTRWLPLPAVAWIGRAAAWALLSFAWQRLSWRLVPRPLFSVLSAGLFVTLNGYCQLAGEWIVGGVEGKSFAYGFVVLAISELAGQPRRDGRAVAFLGAATAFHPLVGGWCGLCLLPWFFAAERPLARLVAIWPAIVLGGGLALVGVLPALALTWGAPADVVAEANRIYVFERLPHHLALLRQPADEFLRQLARHGVLLAALYLLSRPLSARVDAPVHQGAVAEVNWIDLRWVVRFAWMAALIAVLGLLIEITLGWAPRQAAAVQRYYWYRTTDFAAPFAASLLAIAHLAFAAAHRRAGAAAGMTAAVGVIGLFLANQALPRLGGLVPPSDRRMRDPLAWQAVCRWVGENTPSDALFLTPRSNQTFKWHAGRAEVVTRKDIPQDAAHIVEWNARMRDVFLTDAEGSPLAEPFSSPGNIGTERVLRLAEKYGFDHVIATWHKPLWLPVVYPNVAFANEEYVVYRIPKPGGRRRAGDGR